jgi:glutamyl-tRNA synthetase
MLTENTIRRLVPGAGVAPIDRERQFPPRTLPKDAEVTRFAPSPTGYVHLGGIFVSLIAQSVARETGGVFILRIEDTDQERFVPDAVNQLSRALEYCGITPDESGSTGLYGPYRQSERQEIYDTYVADLLRSGRAYPCFCSAEELAQLTARQREAGVTTGYWGPWARCRGLSEADIVRQLDAGISHVVRFLAPSPTGRRVHYVDLIRGPLEFDDNQNDVVIRKTRGLPTYHLAHPIDDHLMRVTTVIRSDEWLSSVPLHLQLFDALGFTVPQYAHIAPLVKMEGNSRRKLSKRKDPEATVDFYITSGYPAEGLLIYLRGLANSRLLDGPHAEVLAAPLRLQECAHGGQLVDLAKLEHICREVIAEMPSAELAERILVWASSFDVDLAVHIRQDDDLFLRALTVARSGHSGPRKDIAKWSDFRAKFGFLISPLFESIQDPSDPRFEPVDPDTVMQMSRKVAEGYQHEVDREAWFDQIRRAAITLGFAPTAGEYKRRPAEFRGTIKDAAGAIRVLLTGQKNSPELYDVARVIGETEVKRRLLAPTLAKLMS